MMLSVVTLSEKRGDGRKQIEVCEDERDGWMSGGKKGKREWEEEREMMEAEEK